MASQACFKIYQKTYDNDDFFFLVMTLFQLYLLYDWTNFLFLSQIIPC